MVQGGIAPVDLGGTTASTPSLIVSDHFGGIALTTGLPSARSLSSNLVALSRKVTRGSFSIHIGIRFADGNEW